MTPTPSTALSTAAARAVLAKHAKSFRFAGLFMPAAQLDDAAVVYAFCRIVDDAIDEAPSREAAQAQARALADELHGRAQPRPEVGAFVEVARRLNLDIAFASGLVEGVAFDANETVRVPDDAGLLQYCYLVAGTVGGMMCAVLGVTDPKALPYAVDLGIGMQLTNICRDVLEDAHRDRVYVSATRLQAAGANTDTFVDDVVAGRANRAAVADVVTDLLAMAERYYASADAGMRFIPWRSRLAIVVAGRVYRAIGRKLLRRGADALAGRVSTSLLEKLGLAVGAVVATVGLQFSPPVAHVPALHAHLQGRPGTDTGA